MHELSIARNVIDQVTRSVSPGEVCHIRSVRLRVGTMAGVVASSLDTTFSALISDTDLEGCELVIDEIPFRVSCRSCGQASTNELGVALCGYCGSADTFVESGRELDLVSLELDEGA